MLEIKPCDRYFDEGQPSSQLFIIIGPDANWQEVYLRCKTHPIDCRYREIKSGWTPLMKAVSSKAPFYVVQVLWDAYPTATVLQDNRGKISLYYATGENNSEVFKFLFDRSKSPPSDILALVLGLPIDLCQNHITPYLGEPLLVPDIEDWPLLHSLLMKNASFSQISMFVKSIPKSLELLSRFNSTALHEACISGNDDEIIELLIQSCPRSASTAMSDGNMPLHLSCKYNLSLRIVQALCDAFPAAISYQNEYGFTPLHSACWSHASIEVIRFLVENFPTAKICTTGPGRFGYTPLQLALNDNRIHYLVTLLT